MHYIPAIHRSVSIDLFSNIQLSPVLKYPFKLYKSKLSSRNGLAVPGAMVKLANKPHTVISVILVHPFYIWWTPRWHFPVKTTFLITEK